MNYRAKLLFLFALTIAATVSLVAWTVLVVTRRVFERVNNERTSALVSQFQREFARRGDEITRQVEAIASGNETLRAAAQVAHPAADYGTLVNEAGSLAAEHQLDFLELLTEDGTIISSAQWPARFGYKESWFTEGADWTTQNVFLKKEELPAGSALALIVVRPVAAGEKKLYVAGGKKLGSEFLASLTLPQGMRAFLYREDQAEATLIDSAGTLIGSEPFLPLLAAARRNPGEQAQMIVRSSTDSEAFHAVPLLGLHHDTLGMFLVGVSLSEQLLLERRIRWLAVIAGGMGILLGLLLSAWASARITKPVEQLATAANEVSEGRWDTHVAVVSDDELGRLAAAFNHMTAQLTEQRDRLVQAERVAAWRELARRLAHELKNPLFPLQITVENLLRARAMSDEQFDEVFRESTSTLLAELANLRAIVGRFSDFAKMPAPQLQSVDLNAIVQNAIRVFEAQFSAPGRAHIVQKIELATGLPPMEADPDMLQRAIQNLILNAIDAMPEGGTLTLRTLSSNENAGLEVSDTGSGLSREECERLFTPYYTTKQHGTGLGLAIVQSVVSDHRGKISVDSEPGRGTTFRILLPLHPSAVEAPANISETPEALVRS